MGVCNSLPISQITLTLFVNSKMRHFFLITGKRKTNVNSLMKK